MINLNDWNKLSVLSVLFFFVYVLRINWAMIPFFFVLRDNFSGQQIVYIIIGISILAVLSSILRYLFFTYRFLGDRVEIKKGVFAKKAISVSYDRIQTVNFKQNLIYQIFNVVTLECDTAGSVQQEVKLPAVSKQIANAIKLRIEQYKGKHNTVLKDEIQENFSQHNIIEKYDFVDLFKIGLTSNRMFIALAGIFTIYNSFSEQLRDFLDYDLDKSVESYAAQTTEGWDFTVFIIVGIIFLIFMFILSIIASIITHFDFKLSYDNNVFKKAYGLLTRRELQLPLDKIQSIEIRQMWLQRWLGFNEMTLRQASSNVRSDDNQFQSSHFTIPLVKNQSQKMILNTLFSKSEFSEFTPIERNYLFRNRLFFGILPTLFLCIGFYFVIQFYAFIFLTYLILFELLLRIRFNNWGYILDEDAIVIRYGFFSKCYKVLYTHKIQQISIHQSPYYYRKDLVKIRFILASATYTIPYIPESDGKKMMNQLLYQVESQNRNWM